MRKRHIKAAIFDLDGTLIDSKKDIIDSTNYMLRKLGLGEKTDEAIRGYIGLGRERLITDALGKGVAPEMVNKAENIFIKYYGEHMFDNTRLFPGVLDVLEYLKDKKLMIVTNKIRSLTVQTLKRFHIGKYFDRVVGGDDANCRKPNACPINNLVAELDIPKNEAIIIGDSDIDIKSGKLAGILTCGLTYGIGKMEDIENTKPDYILDDIRKLKEIIY